MRKGNRKSRVKTSSMTISQAKSGQHIPARKANRCSRIPFASRAIFLNVTTLLNPSTAEQIPKDQRATTPPWRAVGRVDAPY